MSDFLGKLVTMVIHPGTGVRPRLPGRFEPQHLALAGALDIVVADDVGHEAPIPSTQPAQFPDDLAAPSADAPTPGDRRHDPPTPSITPSPAPDKSHPAARLSQPRQPATASPEAAPEPPTVPTRFSPALHPTPKPPTVAREQRPGSPDETGRLSPASTPDSSAAVKGSAEPHLTLERRPVERESARTHPPTAAPAILPEASEIRSPSTPESPASARPTAPTVEPFPLESATHPAVSTLSRPQIESAIPEMAQMPPPEPLLGRADGRATVDPHFTEPMATAPSRRADASQAPTIRVTIGRIEVRATLPPAPPEHPQPARRQPALPLDQYLQRRNEGKR